MKYAMESRVVNNPSGDGYGNWEYDNVIEAENPDEAVEIYIEYLKNYGATVNSDCVNEYGNPFDYEYIGIQYQCRAVEIGK